MRPAPLVLPAGSPATTDSPSAVWQVAVLARAGIDPALEGPARQHALHRAIALRGGSCSWTQLFVGWLVTLHVPEHHYFFGQTLEDALAWSLAWVMELEARTGSSRASSGRY